MKEELLLLSIFQSILPAQGAPFQRYAEHRSFVIQRGRPPFLRFDTRQFVRCPVFTAGTIFSIYFRYYRFALPTLQCFRSFVDGEDLSKPPMVFSVHQDGTLQIERDGFSDTTIRNCL